VRCAMQFQNSACWCARFVVQAVHVLQLKV
jgi:hypothetical protein